MRYLILLTFLTLHLHSFGQKSTDEDDDYKIPLFKEFNFDKGYFTLLIHNEVNNNNAIFDTIGKVYLVQKGQNKITDSTNDSYSYISEVTALNKIKKDWRFYPKELNRDNNCTKQYSINVCKNRQSLKDYSINCDQLVYFNSVKNTTGFFEEKLTKEAFAFVDTNLLQFDDNLKPAFRRVNKYSSIQEAREQIITMLDDTNLIMIEAPLWAKFDGNLVIEYTPKKKLKYYLENKAINTALADLVKEIQAEYPNENFFLEYEGSNGNGNLVIEIRCNQLLGTKFSLYPIECCEWEKAPPMLVSYWKN
ncbi:MAG: hypothetical protein H7331_08705 [Bacteroidia bacterium]|nr:hypothetical protein [Bacteroidia bacterium]